MTSEEKSAEDYLPLASSPTTTSFEYSPSISKDLRDFDDALTHAIDQLRKFNGETMSDLSLKYELMRNNESRVISFFARQLRLLQAEKAKGQNGNIHSEYWKLDRFLCALNWNKKSLEFVASRITFDDVLNRKSSVSEQLLIDAQANESERTDFRNAVTALKNCIEYFSQGGSNDNDRFYWHIETPLPSSPITPQTPRHHRLSDTGLPTHSVHESTRSTSVSSSISTEFGLPNSNHHLTTIPPSPHGNDRTNRIQTASSSRQNHLFANGKDKWEHPSRKTSVHPGVSNNSTSTSTKHTDLQLPGDTNSSRRSSYGSDTEGRLASADSGTPLSPTIRSPTLSASPLGSAQNSDTENEVKATETVSTNSPLAISGFRMAHKIQHKFDRTRVFKFSFCDVCKRQMFRGKACVHCKYKCHKECVTNAPLSCGFSEGKFRRMIDNNDFQNVLAYSTPLPRKYTNLFGDNTSPASSVPSSPAPQLSIPIRESIYSPQNDPDSWVVIDTNIKSVPEPSEFYSDNDPNLINPSESTTNTIDSSSTTANSQNKTLGQLSPNQLEISARDDLRKTPLIGLNSFDDEEADPDKRNLNLNNSLQDWTIGFNSIRLLEKVRRSSGNLMKGHWHGVIAVRIIQSNSNTIDDNFLNQFKSQVFRLRTVRHEHLNLYTGFCIESANLAIVSNWITGQTLYEILHIRNDIIPLNAAIQYAAQITQAMSYLHEKSINHMSLRTTNIFVQNTRIILTDYGLVPFSKCYQFIDQPAIVAPRGWLCYLAPEILRKLDPRNDQTALQHTPQTDVYAFGTVWYELIVREFPFAKQPPEYIIWRAGNSLKQPLSSVLINKYAKDIINQCWSFIPEDRPDFAMLCKSLMKMPGKRILVRSPSTPVQHHTRPHIAT